MSSRLAVRFSRFLVGCHPRRWRERYGDELLDVLDQHHAGLRTVLDLAFSALDAHLDPAWRSRPALGGLRRCARASAPYAAATAVLVLVPGAFVALTAWQESHWHPDSNGGVGAIAFSADQRVMVSAVGFDINGLDTVWDVADPARPRSLATFEGGAPTTISPDGRTVATVSFHGQPVLWNITDPARPVRMVTLPGYPDVLWGQAFSPDGRILAAAYTGRLELWDVTDPARPRRLTTLASQGQAPSHWYGYPCAIAFSPDGRALALTTSRNRVALWNVASPARPVRVATLGGHTGPVAAVAFSPGGRLLADVGHDGAVLVFNLQDPSRPVRSASGRTIVGGSQQPDGHADYYDTSYALAFSADGHTLTVIADTDPAMRGPWATLSASQAISRWSLTDAGAAAPVAVRNGTVAAAYWLAVAPGGRTVARGAPGGGTVTLASLP
jgi:WD40 repeat protein